MLFRFPEFFPRSFLPRVPLAPPNRPAIFPVQRHPRLLQHVRDRYRTPRGFRPGSRVQHCTPLAALGASSRQGRCTQKLPRRYDLQQQIISVRFDWSRHAVVGSTTLRIAALDVPLDTINLNAVGMKIKRVIAVNSGPVTYTYDDTTLAIHPSRPLAPHTVTLITVDYETVKPPKGVYFIDRVHYLWTQGETDDTRYWVPTYDHPDDKTTWEINVITDPDERALSNGRLVSSKRVPEGMQWSWSLDKPASTYLDEYRGR